MGCALLNERHHRPPRVVLPESATPMIGNTNRTATNWLEVHGPLVHDPCSLGGCHDLIPARAIRTRLTSLTDGN
jgi:hypothetical protein